MSESNLVLQSNQPAWIRYIHRRIKRNQNFIAFIEGPTGSGKSWSCLSIGKMLEGDKFNIDHITFSPMEALQQIEKGYPGKVIVLEEIGVNASNRDWQSKINKVLSYLFQTVRHRQLIFLLNAPFVSFVDAALRKLLHAKFITTGINRQDKTCLLKAFSLQYNSDLDKTYRKRLKVITPKGVLPVDIWEVPRPDEELIKQYEAKKLVFTEGLNKKIRESLEKEAEKEEGRQNKCVLTTYQKITFDKLNAGMTVPEIAKSLDMSNGNIYGFIKQMKKKGFEVIAEGKKSTDYAKYTVILPQIS